MIALGGHEYPTRAPSNKPLDVIGWSSNHRRAGGLATSGQDQVGEFLDAPVPAFVGHGGGPAAALLG